MLGRILMVLELSVKIVEIRAYCRPLTAITDRLVFHWTQNNLFDRSHVIHKFFRMKSKGRIKR